MKKILSLTFFLASTLCAQAMELVVARQPRAALLALLNRPQDDSGDAEQPPAEAPLSPRTSFVIKLHQTVFKRTTCQEAIVSQRKSTMNVLRSNGAAKDIVAVLGGSNSLLVASEVENYFNFLAQGKDATLEEFKSLNEECKKYAGSIIVRHLKACLRESEQKIWQHGDSDEKAAYSQMFLESRKIETMKQLLPEAQTVFGIKE